jgi:2-dehydro-3-deoxy-D-arabinonate dehydratase
MRLREEKAGRDAEISYHRPMSIRIFRSATAVFLENDQSPGLVREAGSDFCFNALFTAENPASYVEAALAAAGPELPLDSSVSCQPPIGDQEVWAAGVTYFRSRTARMEEAESSGGDIFYDKVYEAPRPELFFKATAPRTRGHGDHVAIRSDSTWDVPEPELTLAISSRGEVFGHTIGNDMSSRSIEGENPLYLPQAKVYTGSCAIGPCLVVGPAPGPETVIAVAITRGGVQVFSGETTVSQIKRSFTELAGYLFRANEFRYGAYLMTGTGVVPDSSFTLAPDDVVAITIDGIGTLENVVERV